MRVEQDVKKVYGETLLELMRENDRVYAVDADLMRISGADAVAKAAPERYVNAGIAEQNAVDVAAGLAAMGNVAFVSSFCGFLGTRASDQCLNTVCYNELNVKLLGTYAGVSSAINGGTHISIADIAAFRSMPGMRIIEVADGNEMKWALKEATAIDGPVYIRTPKGPLADIFPEGTAFAIGKGQTLSVIGENDRPKKRIALITSGITTAQGVKAAEILRGEGTPITHIHMTTIKPLDERLIAETAKTHDMIVTADNHSVVGGLGTAVCEAVAGAAPVRVVRLGVEDQFCEGMTQEELESRHGISAERIAETIKGL